MSMKNDWDLSTFLGAFWVTVIFIWLLKVAGFVLYAAFWIGWGLGVYVYKFAFNKIGPNTYEPFDKMPWPQVTLKPHSRSQALLICIVLLLLLAALVGLVFGVVEFFLYCDRHSGNYPE